MRKRLIILFSVLYFVFVNTSYFWEKLPGLWDIALTGILFIAYIVLLIILIVQFIQLIKSKFGNKPTLLNCIILSTVLILTFLFPLGIIDFKQFEGPNLIVAQYEGVANCTSTLEIKGENRFIERSICFGIDEYRGTYILKGDTIKLFFDKESSFDSKYAFALIKLDSTNSLGIGTILYYKDSLDNNPIPMEIFKYDMK